jgi:hypothetical protein
VDPADVRRLPVASYLSGACQRFSNIGEHRAIARLIGRVASGLGIRSAITGALGIGRSHTAPPPGALGAASRFAEGEWVRVIEADRVRSTLDANSKLRGLEWGPQQWYTCGRSFRVSKVVRRMIDDGGRVRLVSRTVLLDGVDCGGEHGDRGCGRRCPMMYRDDWLEPSGPAPVAMPVVTPPVSFVTVRSAEQIAATLDPLGRRGALLFMPEMLRYAGQRLPVARRIDRVQELGRWTRVPEGVFVLGGVRCTGAILGANAPCDRQCDILWHADWLTPD